MVNLIQNSSAPSFAGEFRHKIEGKNRLTIPAAWRFAEEVDLFMVKRTTEKCIGVLPTQEIERIKADVTRGMTPENRTRFLSLFGRSLFQVKLDKAGRITIPDELCQQLNLGKEVWLSGAIETFNIWSLADFEVDKTREAAARDDVMRQAGI